MQQVSRVFKILALSAVAILHCSLAPLTSAQESSLNAIADHSHDPITVRSKPVIERLPVKVVRPVDLAVTSKNQILIADSGADCIFQLEEDGTVSLRAENLRDIKRICVDSDDSVYVLTSTTGEARIHQVTPDGKLAVLHVLNAPATCFARLADGTFAVAGSDLYLTKFDEPPTRIEKLNQPAVDMTKHISGGAELLFGSGVVMSLSSSGELVQRGMVPAGSSRLISLPTGRLAGLVGDSALKTDAGQKSGLFAIQTTEDAGTESRPVAHVPQGTLAVGFDRLGNLALANPDLRAITKVTAHFEVPCPHCGKPTRLNLVPAAAGETTSF
ncbi:MAG: hypothetical protein JNM43_09195 [Planctomycetaceae bacterium]|nr:hypothetical protein [Planctomycetaceae bacterium]